MSNVQPKRAARSAALFAFGFAGAAAASVLLLTGDAHARMRTSLLSIEKATGGTVSLSVEVAESDQEKAAGLMFRTKLGDGEGMLFHYGRPMEISMWMRNTYIPLDMVFIRPDGVIHRIAAMTEPLSDKVISSEGPASAVLEIPGGAAVRHGIKAGDRVHHEIFDTSKAK